MKGPADGAPAKPAPWDVCGGVVVERRMDQLTGGDFAFDGVEEADEFAVRWRCMQRPITVPSSTLSAANRVVWCRAACSRVSWSGSAPA
jgi:hypothetical protein